MTASGPRPHDLEAVVEMLSTEAGGRLGPAFDDYRPGHDFGHPSGELNGGIHVYPDGGVLAPGETGRVFIWLAVHERNAGRLGEGQAFTVQEAPRVVGRGRITRVVTETLRRA